MAQKEKQTDHARFFQPNDGPWQLCTVLQNSDSRTILFGSVGPIDVSNWRQSVAGLRRLLPLS
jgi:hypothetical protein